MVGVVAPTDMTGMTGGANTMCRRYQTKLYTLLLLTDTKIFANPVQSYLGIPYFDWENDQMYPQCICCSWLHFVNQSVGGCLWSHH